MAKEQSVFSEHIFTLQWHITARCQQRCAHCYMYDEATYNKELANELTQSDCIRIMDDFKEFCQIMNVGGRISFTGGDPLLRDDYQKLIKGATDRNFYVGILGNPHLITDDTSRLLKAMGVKSYQLSLDGLEETHDSLRQKGSFKKTIQAVQSLKTASLSVGIMTTLSADNIQEILELMEFVGQLGVDAFAFARISAVGEGKQYKALPISPLAYRDFLISIEAKAQQLNRAGIKTRYRKKCHLWKLLDFENGKLDLPNDKEMVFGGCTMGVTGLVLLADGVVMACRRFPSPVGKLPEMKLFDIFIKSKEMKQYRDYHKLEKCSKCELINVCRGCPAVAYGQSGNWHVADPQCWKMI